MEISYKALLRESLHLKFNYEIKKFSLIKTKSDQNANSQKTN